MPKPNETSQVTKIMPKIANIAIANRSLHGNVVCHVQCIENRDRSSNTDSFFSWGSILNKLLAAVLAALWR